MKSLIFVTSILLSFVSLCKAQSENPATTEHDPAVRAKDSLIKEQIIDPVQQAAKPGDPDWDAITKNITAEYDATTADRTVCKAKIYYYYNRDKAIFCTNIVHYTDAYELANDFQLLNVNAGMILQFDENQKELKEALRWAKTAADSDPDNEQYQDTYNSLKTKVTQ